MNPDERRAAEQVLHEAQQSILELRERTSAMAKKNDSIPADFKGVKRILHYENRKIGDLYWDVSTPESEAGAFLEMFGFLDKDWMIFSHLNEPLQEEPTAAGHPEGCMCEGCVRARKRNASLKGREQERLALFKVVEQARKGDARAARSALNNVKDDEYVRWKIIDVEVKLGQYPARFWGVEKPCNVVQFHPSGLVRWMSHGKPQWRVGKTQKAAMDAYARVLRLDLSKAETVMMDAQWVLKVRAPEPGEEKTERDIAASALNAEDRDADHALKLVKQGTFEPVEVLQVTKQFCGGCQREVDRFGPGVDPKYT